MILCTITCSWESCVSIRLCSIYRSPVAVMSQVWQSTTSVVGQRLLTLPLPVSDCFRCSEGSFLPSPVAHECTLTLTETHDALGPPVQKTPPGSPREGRAATLRVR
eukprot:EG_transcript_39660